MGNEKRGQQPYDPQMMTKVMVYGYCVGVQFTPDEAPADGRHSLRVLGAGNQPNFRTISDFRKIHLKTLEGRPEVEHVGLVVPSLPSSMKTGRIPR